jgi:hypothetical protein
MKQVKINPDLKHNNVDLYSPDNAWMGWINYLQLIDIQCQICENSLEGYHIGFNGERIDIDSDGHLAKWPKGMFGMPQRLFVRLIKTRKAKNK